MLPPLWQAMLRYQSLSDRLVTCMYFMMPAPKCTVLHLTIAIPLHMSVEAGSAVCKPAQRAMPAERSIHAAVAVRSRGQSSCSRHDDLSLWGDARQHPLHRQRSNMS